MLFPLNKVVNLKDPLKMFTANFQIVFQTGSPLASLVDSENIELRCQSFGLPKIVGDKTEVEWGGFKRTYAGKQTRNGEWKIQVTEVWDAKLTEIFRVWNNQYHNFKEGTISLLDQYTATVNVALVNPDLYDPKPQGIQRYDMRLYDVFPTEVAFPTIKPSSSDPINIDVTLHFNHFLLGSEITD